MKLHRVDGILPLDIVQGRKIIFLGAGSLGSLTLANLVYPWRQIVLIDGERLEMDNIERHLLGRSSVGLPKVEGLQKWLVDKDVNPDSIVAHQATAEEVLDEHTDADLLISAIDVPASRLFVNAWCKRHNIPALYGGVYPKGVGGQVFVIPNADQVCCQCADLMMGTELRQERRQTDYGLGIEQFFDGAPKAVPALHSAVGAIATQMALLAMDLLVGEETVPPQVLIQTLTWEPVLILQPGETAGVVADFVLAQPDLNLLPSIRLRKSDETGMQLQMKRGIVSLVLKRHENCPNHSVTVDLNNI